MPHTYLRTERRLLPGAIEAIRRLQNKTQLEVAANARDEDGEPLSNTTIAHIEAGRRQPSLEVMCRIAESLGVDLESISYLTDVYVADADTPPFGAVESVA